MNRIRKIIQEAINPIDEKALSALMDKYKFQYTGNVGGSLTYKKAKQYSVSLQSDKSTIWISKVDEGGKWQGLKKFKSLTELEQYLKTL